MLVALSDITETLEGIGLELEAIKIIARAVAIEQIERNPLRGTHHDDTLPGEHEDPPDIPPWVHG